VAEVDAYEAAEDRRDGAEHSLRVKGRLAPHRGARRGGTGPGSVHTALLREEGEIMKNGEGGFIGGRPLVCHDGREPCQSIQGVGTRTTKRSAALSYCRKRGTSKQTKVSRESKGRSHNIRMLEIASQPLIFT
jgi:hypothetical protein